MKSPIRSFFQTSFILCAAVLAVAASTKEYTIQKLGIHFIKFPLPLQKHLEEMEESKLAPYTVMDKRRIPNRDVLESLGTDEYLQWTLEDPDAPKDSPVRRCSLFITYYTGNPDMVPHVPDECYVGGGNTRLSGDTIRIKLTPILPDPERIPSELPESVGAQSILFSQISKGPIPIEKKFYVNYLFKANGKYAANRTETRALLGSNFTSKYSYFCKVEWWYYGIDNTNDIVYPDQDQTLAASQKLLSILLSILETDHWPDWEQANRKTQEPLTQ